MIKAKIFNKAKEEISKFENLKNKQTGLAQ